MVEFSKNEKNKIKKELKLGTLYLFSKTREDQRPFFFFTGYLSTTHV